MTEAQDINPHRTETLALKGKPGMSVATRRQVTQDLLRDVRNLDMLLDDQARLVAARQPGDEPSISLRIVQQEIDDTLNQLRRLPALPRVGDKVQVEVGDDMAVDPQWLPGIVVGYHGGTSVRVLTRHGELERTAARCLVTDHAVYVPAPAAEDGAR